MAKETAGRLRLDELEQLVASGEIDTIVNALCDMQGRLMGKRVRAEFFVEHVREHGTHFCTYLLGTDMEMTTPGGYRLMNWDTGYGDWVAQPDFSTLRRIPWLEGTALVLADAVDEETGELIPVAPRAILRRQVERAHALGLRPMMASELEFYLLKDSFEEAFEKGYRGLRPIGWYNEDYHLFQGTKAEPIYRQVRNLMTAAAIPIEFSKGEAAAGQHEINIRYADALESADRAVLFKHGVKEIAYANGCAVTFMAKPHHTWTGSSSHIHLSFWDAAGERNLFYDPAGQPYHMSRVMQHALAGLIAHARALSLFVASNVNSYKRYAVASWAPVNVVWGRDNRTCGFRIVGHGNSLRIENRIPGADANPYLAYAAMIAAALDGIERERPLPPEHRGNAYTAEGVVRVPRTLAEATEEFARSELARTAFGDLVIEHYVNMARVEQETYDAVVTDWELYRYFERG
jgi:glutamine synthetase